MDERDAAGRGGEVGGGPPGSPAAAAAVPAHGHRDRQGVSGGGRGVRAHAGDTEASFRAVAEEEEMVAMAAAAAEESTDQPLGNAGAAAGKRNDQASSGARGLLNGAKEKTISKTNSAKI